MQKSLAELRPQLEEMNKKAIEMMNLIEHETKTVERASELVKKDEEVANKQAAAAQALKRECEADLAEAIPILEEVNYFLFIFFILLGRFHFFDFFFFYSMLSIWFVLIS